MTDTNPSVWVDDGAIVHVSFGKQEKVTRAAVKMLHEKRLLISTEKLPVLLNTQNIIGYDEDAVDFLRDESVLQYISAIGIITGSSLSKILGQMFMSYHKPPRPTRLFTSEKEASAWLKQFTPQEIEIAV